MPTQPASGLDRRQALLKAMKALTTLPGRAVFFDSALLAIAATGGAALTGPLSTLNAIVGVNAFAQSQKNNG